ncbi:type I methionyl aminopeptidase [bacterium]|nr:MAG: type I methionyl aminopeptidase [bacterium]
MIEFKSRREIDLMRRAGVVVAETIYALCKKAKPGITTGELAAVAADVIESYGAESAFLNYRPRGAQKGFPGVVCISINEEVVHGIPGNRKIADGDVVSFDVGVRLDGYCGDGAGTVIVGNASDSAKRLLDITRQCLYNGIEQAVPGNRIKDIGRAVQVTAESAGFGVVRELVGHGIGREVHEEPQVPNFVTTGFSENIRRGLTIAIEPMITAGSWQVVQMDDGWTVSTADKSLAAHYEHTIAVTENGPQILTLRENGKEGFDLV